MGAVLKEHEDQIQEMTLIPSGGGCFEVEADGELLYSKLETGRHTDPGEILKLVQTFIEER